MQELFKENFKILNENFGETFKELFKGGSAELILAEGDELTANIDINVEPPGKKLQNINLNVWRRESFICNCIIICNIKNETDSILYIR